MSEHDVRTYARAIAFQVLTSLIPLALLVLAVAGFLEVEELWTEDLAPQFEAQVNRDERERSAGRASLSLLAEGVAERCVSPAG